MASKFIISAQEKSAIRRLDGLALESVYACSLWSKWFLLKRSVNHYFYLGVSVNHYRKTRTSTLTSKREGDAIARCAIIHHHWHQHIGPLTILPRDVVGIFWSTVCGIVLFSCLLTIFVVQGLLTWYAYSTCFWLWRPALFLFRRTSSFQTQYPSLVSLILCHPNNEYRCRRAMRWRGVGFAVHGSAVMTVMIVTMCHCALRSDNWWVVVRLNHCAPHANAPSFTNSCHWATWMSLDVW